MYMEIQALQMTPVTMRATSHLGETIEKEPAKSFGTYLKDALSEVNQLQLESDRQNKLLAAGEVTDVSQVIVAGQKADIALHYARLSARDSRPDLWSELLVRQQA